MKKKVISLMCVLSMLVALVACGNNAVPSASTAAPPPAPEASGSASTAPPSDTNAGGRTLALSKAPGDYKICIYWPAPDTYFEANIQPGYQAMEKEYGVKLEHKIGTEWTQDVENQIVEAMAAQGYDLFLIYGADTSGANALYKELANANCKVVNYGGTVDDPQEAALTICGDVYQYSYEATIKMIESLGGKAKIINVLENLGDVNTLARQKGVEDAVAKYPDSSIVQTIGDINTEDEGYEKVSNALAANPTATGIIATGGTASRGMTNALTDFYATNENATHLYAVATDPSEEVLNGIENGILSIGIAQNGFGQGYLGGLALLYMAEGWSPVKWGEHIVTGYVFIDKSNLTTFNQDIEQLTQKISMDFESKYLTK